MNDFVSIANISEVFTGRRKLPTTVMWNRLEGRPRTTDFSRALRAEVRDPLWLISRQWQMGEFQGEDAGTPVTAKLAWRSDTVDHVHAADGTPLPYDPTVPLEALVEARPVALVRAGLIHNADLRLALGQRWTRLLQDNGHVALIPAFRTAYAFVAPDPAQETDNSLTASAASWQTLAAIAARAIDGGALLIALTGGAVASDALGLVDPEKGAIDAIGESFRAWAIRLYFQPDEALASWQPRHLEYGVGLSAPTPDNAAALAAPEYRGGRLDWFHFDAVRPQVDDVTDPAASTTSVTSFIPTTAQFEGMPSTRHWTFEEGLTSFGDIKPDTTDIAKLLLIEFGLVYANDWFLLPIELPVGSLTQIKGLAVTNSFGERTWIEPAVSAGDATSGWQMFRLTGKDAMDGRLFLPATTPLGLESVPVEAVDLIRDEVSNMVWGIERTVQLPDGSSRRGREIAQELHARYQSGIVAVPTLAPLNDATIRYKLMTSVAEHWIPFIPVHVPGDNREIQLQRAAMPRMLDGTEGVIPKKIAPRTALLREGLDGATPASYFIAEEEVERAGTTIETRWQRCRWINGEVITWLSNRRITGRGESTSGLAFDVLTPKQSGQ